MISRRSTLAIAEAYQYLYTDETDLRVFDKKVIRYHSGSLYDFLFRYEIDEWLVNLFMEVPHLERSLKDFILRIHTGESLVSATQWDWNQRKTYGQMMLARLAQSLLRERETNPQFCTYSAPRELLHDMQASLELDGDLYRNGCLLPPERTVIQETEEQDLLEALAVSLELSDIKTIKHHLDLSVTDFLGSRWDNSIGDSRKALEAILEQAAYRHNKATGRLLQRGALADPDRVRQYLQREGLLSPSEKRALTEVYGLLSETGGHPYIAQRDQARLMRNLALTFTQFVLLRLDGALRSRTAASP